MSANGALPLSEVRARAAGALAPASESDPDVLLDVVDSVSPPTILLVWADPWLTAQTYGPSLFEAQLSILCVASRVEPGPGVEKLEEIVSYAVSRLAADEYPWPQASSQAPRVFRIGGIDYLGARVTYRVPVSIEGSP